jgi:3-oxo-5-alpha-steroid 4-dehydrogenase 3
MDLKPAHALGPLSDWTVPQRWFAHFYALGALWNAALAYALLSSPFWTDQSVAQRAGYSLALGLLQLHLVRRLVETLGLLRCPPNARMHGIAYLFGLRWATTARPPVARARICHASKLASTKYRTVFCCT